MNEQASEPGADDPSEEEEDLPSWGSRVTISLACTECKARNYKTTKAPAKTLELKKFCKHCKKHTLHRETR